MKCTIKKIIELPNITFEKVLCAYKGNPNTCMCGCSGDYFYTSRNRQAAGKDRGYEVVDVEVNDNKVKQIIRIVLESQPHIEVIDNYIFTVYRNEAQYTIYLAKPAK